LDQFQLYINSKLSMKHNRVCEAISIYLCTELSLACTRNLQKYEWFYEANPLRL